MIDARAKELIRQGDALFNKRTYMMQHWQNTAEEFYPEKADFLSSLLTGDDLASHLSSSAPILIRRDLGNSFSSFLRPRNTQWFNMTTGDDDDDIPHDAKLWLEEKEATQKNAMSDRISGFDRATKESDHDYVTFGQAVLLVEINYRDQAILVRNIHIRDVAWSEDFTGQIRRVHRKWKPSASSLMGTFQESKLHKEVIKAMAKDPEREFECRHIVMPVEEYERVANSENQLNYRTKFVSIYIDVENNHVIEESPSATLKYVIPRWQTVSGSQYSYSQAAIAGLPTARTLQAMTLSLLEAGEHAANPPRYVVEEALRGEMNLFARGITYVSGKWAEKGMEPIKTLATDKNGIGYGMQMLENARMELREAFFIDKINLPVMEPGVTAYEISQRVAEYIRNAMPLFDPVEGEYSAPLMETIFEEMMVYGFFGQEIPESLQTSEIKFKFRSPLRDAEDRNKAGAFMEGLGMIEATSELAPDTAAIADMRKGLREALAGIEWPTDWTYDDETVDASIAQAQQKQETMEMIEMAGAGGEAMKAIGEGGEALQGGVA